LNSKKKGPAVVAPLSYGLIKDLPSTQFQRQLVLLGKIFQNLSNGVEFGTKEQGIEGLNEFMKENEKLLNQFYEQVMNRKDKVETVKIPDQVKENALTSIHKLIEENYSSLDEVIFLCFFVFNIVF